MRTPRGAAVVIVALLVPAAAAAQPRRPISRPPALSRSHPARFVVDLSGGARSAGPAVSDRLTFETNVETATVDMRYPSSIAPLFTAGVAVQVWKQVGIGVAVATATRSGAATVDGRIPDPFRFEQPRALTGSAPGLKRSDTAVHLNVHYAAPVTERMTLTLSAGPTLARVAQDLITDVRYNETYPYDAVTFTSAVTTRATASAVGFHAGADLRWMFSRGLGIGALVRYANATVDLPAADRTVSVRTGGTEAGVGVRVAF